jgi:tetratricopeptide (TPR) repeat protein
MGLRTITLADAPAEAPRFDWRRRVEETVAHGAACIRESRFADYRALLEGLAGWEDEQRAFQARQQLVELAFATPSRPGQDAWIELYLEAGRGVVDALAQNPSEPLLLNYAGVLLYELTEFAAAEALFRAAAKLDPELQHVQANLKAARQRKRAGRVRMLKGRARIDAAGLADRARRLCSGARPAQDLTLSLCMIVKDEEELLPGCLEAAAPHVDEMIVVDTGSSDRTVEIARSFGATVIEFPWNGSFSDARNVSLDAASGDWVMYLDADEHLVPEDAARLRELLGKTWREGFYLVETNYTGGEDSGASVTHLALRLFKNRPGYRFEGRIHEQKTHNMPTYLPERFENSGIRMLHYGYLKSRISAKEKSRRNIELLELEARETPSAFNAFNLGSEYLQLGDAEQGRVHFDRAWAELQEQEGWQSVGYAPMLVSRAATVRRVAGDPAAARALIAEGLAAFPDHTDLVFELALCAKDESDLDEAARFAQRCLELGDGPARYAGTVGAGSYLALCLLGEIADQRGDAQAAMESYRESLRSHPHFVAPVLPLATLLFRAGASPEDVLRETPAERPSALMLAATACYEQGHAEDAEAWFRKVLERQPANGAARIGLVEALLSQKRYGDAAAEAALEPADSQVASAAVRAELFAHGAAGDAAQLLATLRRGVDIPVADRTFHEAWAAALAGEDLPLSVPAAAAVIATTALEALLRVQEIDAFATLLPVYERIALPAGDRSELLARMYFRRGYLDSAADEWIEAYDRKPEARALVGLAQVAVAKGLQDDAVELATGALGLEPGNEDAAAMVRALAAPQRLAS